jgi:FkbM family methyltransferase
MKSIARKAIEIVLNWFEYRLADKISDPTGLAGACERLKSRGFSPNTVLDVGVGPGTPWLYAAFPDAHFELFEPQDSFRPMIEQTTRELDAKVNFVALGPKPGTLTIQVNVANPTSSTLARYDDVYTKASFGDGPRPAMVERQVPVCTLDEFGPFEGPVLLKLDVEGYEAEVLAGALRTLQTVDVIISEVSVARRTEAELSIGGYISLLESLGFSAINIAEIAPLGRGGPIAYMDVVFVRSNSPMRYGA